MKWPGSTRILRGVRVSLQVGDRNTEMVRRNLARAFLIGAALLLVAHVASFVHPMGTTRVLSPTRTRELLLMRGHFAYESRVSGAPPPPTFWNSSRSVAGYKWEVISMATVNVPVPEPETRRYVMGPGVVPEWEGSNIRQIKDRLASYGRLPPVRVLTVYRLTLPLPGLFLLLLIYPLTFWLPHWVRHWCRARAGRCVRCGYDLTGNLSGICPECGAAL
jgi:hypothetical protein